MRTRVGRLATLVVTATAALGWSIDADAEMWRGLRVGPESRCSQYQSSQYSYPQSVELRIIESLGGIWSPYTGREFAHRRETDIEHIVARSEAHDSGLCAASTNTRRQFSRDLLNLTLASPSVNRHQKRDHDAAEWLPALNQCWFADRVVRVRQKYNLTIDRREADALDRVAVDSLGRAVSFIQSIYWEFGSATVLEETGITWQNRGTSFSLDPNHPNCLKPYRRPFHTIQPALARLVDGRVMPYGSMGGEGQPQTQGMVFSRHVLHGQELQQAVTAPRWLLGRTWGQEATNLRIEKRFEPTIIKALRNAGHDIEEIGQFDEIMGHAGALVHHPNGLIEGAADPRGDGIAAAF